jgi:hypothetical protein
MRLKKQRDKIGPIYGVTHAEQQPTYHHRYFWRVGRPSLLNALEGYATLFIRSDKKDRAMSFPLYSDPIPALTTAQMIEVDRAMIEEYHIDLIQMMENAGCNLAHLARERFLAGDPRGING